MYDYYMIYHIYIYMYKRYTFICSGVEAPVDNVVCTYSFNYVLSPTCMDITQLFT